MTSSLSSTHSSGISLLRYKIGSAINPPLGVDDLRYVFKDILTWTTGKSQCKSRHLSVKLLRVPDRVWGVNEWLVFDRFFTIILDINR